MAAGEVIRYNPVKRYGFIRDDESGQDVLLHEEALCPGEETSWIRRGVRVSFDVRRTPKGMRAANVRTWLEDRPSGRSGATFRDEVAEVLAGAASQIEDIARKYGWVD